ncbi:MAG: hypothetical protein K6T88_02590 [Bacillus sp. (in: Bacteria)]|jgi:hypothetical protein|nr:hypothetical protein [Bacillus sp. (in: firmicutes)]
MANERRNRDRFDDDVAGVTDRFDRKHRDQDDDSDVAGVSDRQDRRRLVLDVDQVIIRADRVIIIDEDDDRKRRDRDDRRDDRRGFSWI